MSIEVYRLILYAVLLLLVIWRVAAAGKKGFAGELQNAFSMAAACIAGYFLYSIAVSYASGQFGRIVWALLYLAILLTIYKLLNLLFGAVKLFAKLPVIRGIDKILGGILGVFEAVFIAMALLTALPILMDLDWVSIGENAYETLFRVVKELPWKEWGTMIKEFFKGFGKKVEEF